MTRMSVPVVCVLLFAVLHHVLCYSPLRKLTPVSEEVAVASSTSNRLPHNIIPLSYHIHLTPYLQPENLTFDGNLLLYFNVANGSIQDIILNSVNLSVSEVKLENRENSTAPELINCTFYNDVDLGRLIVSPSESLTLNINYALTILYSARLRGSDDLRGFYYGSYVENNQVV